MFAILALALLSTRPIVLLHLEDSLCYNEDRGQVIAKRHETKTTNHTASYSDYELQDWRSRRYSLVNDCSPLLKRRLLDKARARTGRRFFGETKVLAMEPYDEAWYGSFKWLTSPRWSGAAALSDRYQEHFRRALMIHFPDLCDFQQRVAMSLGSIDRRKPVGPDLWLITPKQHRFIEVKLPRDTLARHQLVGLALIGMFLRGDRPISVEVVNLYNGERPPKTEPQLGREFAEICEKLANDTVTAS